MTVSILGFTCILICLTFISSTCRGSSIELPFLAKKSWVRASRRSDEKTMSSLTSPEE